MKFQLFDDYFAINLISIIFVPFARLTKRLCSRFKLSRSIVIMEQTLATQPAGLLRRLGALLYDAVAVMMTEILAVCPILVILKLSLILNLFDQSTYPNINEILLRHPIVSPLITFYLASVWIVFFVWFWTRTGQTWGMKAWKLIIKSDNGGQPTLTQALIRLFTSGFGLANFTVPFDPHQRGFHDLWAKTQIYVLHKSHHDSP
jgi:uncharacterized RDD family membrane protein YckC